MTIFHLNSHLFPAFRLGPTKKLWLRCAFLIFRLLSIQTTINCLNLTPHWPFESQSTAIDRALWSPVGVDDELLLIEFFLIYFPPYISARWIVSKCLERDRRESEKILVNSSVRRAAVSDHDGYGLPVHKVWKFAQDGSSESEWVHIVWTPFYGHNTHSVCHTRWRETDVSDGREAGDGGCFSGGSFAGPWHRLCAQQKPQDGLNNERDTNVLSANNYITLIFVFCL